MKAIALGLFLLGSASSFASFEMMLLADNTNGVIHRYDPVNHVYLGSFGRGSIGAVLGLSLDQANNRVFIRQDNLVNVFDYNTGNQLFVGFALGIGPVMYRSTFGDMISFSGTQLLRQTVGLNSLGNQILWTATSPGVTSFTTDGTLIYGTNTVNGQMLSYTGASIGSIFGTSLVNAILAGDSVPGMSVNESTGGVFALSQTDKRYNYWSGVSGTNIFQGNTSTLTTTTAITRAHGIHQYILGTTPTGVGLQKFYEDGNIFGAYTQVSLPSAIGSINHAATVITPEPGTMIAIAVGLAALAKRRKK